ncbi:biotin carboxylase N-terminal domain-containing protein [Shewanella amazonensis]|uniref:Acetyl-CoA carboxylase multifunctional enzyme accADC, carboxyl transferase subunit alpha/carboxyl transferase subunit beta/biotin carboxylase n=1 Tax=Shewanella amazonensis (strain ATCC BAA-1098 / SB2B) TaxID=326297 RepID=A1S332_SHEAM|nr:biotin carboxylase N-terminal domain-containing protein [Shewanella amazonensis]ABL98788.1 acetyl-CoA carboxylase multifunctional enzyme accADC, carboxyl transferase subunit alpha/carboxyl transferase subunit beta/biotin carboxylase [Shewanella amazonensis SB2B]
MTTNKQPKNMTQAQKPDPLFLQAEHLAKDFSLFPEHSKQSLSEEIKGLLDDAAIQTNLKSLAKLDVDGYVAKVIQPTQDKNRPGAKRIIADLKGKVITETHMGSFYSAEVDLNFGSRTRRIGFVAQERTTANGAWMPEHHLAACKAIRHFAELSMPIVYLIDTPGADAGEIANSNNQAHSISKAIAESANVDVPTVGIVIGAGYSGGAIPLAAANILLSLRDGIFNTIQPQGLQSIARKYNLSWQECAKSVGVSPEELYNAGCIDGIIDFSPSDRDERQHNLRRAIISSIEAVERAAVNFVKESKDLREHYERSLTRFLNPSNSLKALESTADMAVASSPTMHLNLFGSAYRYLRYLTLRSRIHSISMEQYGRLSKVSVPEGDLLERIQKEQEKVFQAWLSAPDKVVYDEELSKLWNNFVNKRSEVSTERNMLTRLILGEPKENYKKAKKALLFNIGWSLYHRWKSNAANNFKGLIHYLETLPAEVTEANWPELNNLTVLDVVVNKELREDFIWQCYNILIFNALYDNVVGSLASIAKEAMMSKSLSRASVDSLLHKAIDRALSTQDIANDKSKFYKWLKYFMSQSNRAELLTKTEQWKSVGFPQLNDSLFVILTYFFERLLPEYFDSEDDTGKYTGAINPVRIGRRKDFWNRLTMGYQDLLIQKVLRDEKKAGKMTWENVINKFFTNFDELNGDKMTANLLNFPGFRLSIEDALDKGIRPCGLITGMADFEHKGASLKVGIAVSNTAFQAGAFDMASAEKFSALLIECAKRHMPVICFISSGGMQTKEGAAALFSMAVVNDRITRFIRDNELPVLMFGFGDCTGGAQASFVTHPLVQTYYLSGTNMPFAGQMVVPAYLPSTSTLSNYLSKVPGAMNGLVYNPFSDTLDSQLSSIDPLMPMPTQKIEEVIKGAISTLVPEAQVVDEEIRQDDPRALMKPIDKVLVHARGCTAVKLIRKAHDNNINVVLVASDPDMTAVPADMLKENDKLVCLGGNTSDESYLNAYSVLKVAEYENVDALHPGIGFLSESPQFAALCVNNGVNFVGPSVHSMTTMGNKSNAIKTSQAQNVPVVPGSHGILSNAEQAVNVASEIGYPVLLKAVQGGGGKGIQVVKRPEDMIPLFMKTSTEAAAAFGNGDLYLEKYVTSLRHIEVQLLRDKFGNAKVLGLRDCSVQRNNQKVIEESGSTMLPPELKQQVMAYTKSLGDAVDYMGAGTVEFIYNLDANEVYFMEMNTRLQVEHPVTEATSGIDIVSAQFDIAAGRSIEDLEPQEIGYAMEVRVTAEKAALDSNGVLQLVPNPGKITECVMPERDDVEIISIAAEGKEVSPYYDSLIAQIIIRGESREDVVTKMYDYLDSVVIKGIATNIPLLKRILKDATFNEGVYDTNYLPRLMAELDIPELIAEMEAAAETQGVDTESLRVGDSNELKVLAQGAGIFYSSPAPGEPEFVREGDIVTTDTTLALTEAMKMFSQVTLASFNRKGAVLYPEDKKYRIERILNTNGQQVSQGDLLFVVSPVED